MKALCAVPLLLLAAPAAAGSFTPPEGCTLNMTVQSRGCNVSNYYTCEADAAGDQWRADYDQEGAYFRSKIDYETQWIESYEINPPVMQVLDPNPVDPASFSELLASGYDSFAFGLSKDTGARSTVRGFDRLTGQSVVIDGQTLLQTEYEMTETDADGTILRKARGREFVSADFRSFFAGASEIWTGDEWLPFEGSPMSFDFEGDNGFGATQPIFDCDAVLSWRPELNETGPQKTGPAAG
ncbi:MAG: hypothetical protein ACK4SS_03780 [Cypionkella sp.]